ncbi:hypothetical protein niasHT_004485 [Heterodera trifolii]|uniref:Uncharacterized protein n=1 Tax=Heterodera trifolii TaxID=157864 RepID=A0ABD2MDE5_9BILA
MWTSARCLCAPSSSSKKWQMMGLWLMCRPTLRSVSDDFMIHQEAANRDKYTLEVADCRLIVKTVDLMDGLSLDIAKKLDMEPARYGIRKTLMKSLFITGGRYDFSANLFTEEVPRRV